MSRIEKQSAKLDHLESTFRSRLIERLRVSADGGDSLLFHAAAVRPDHWPASVKHQATDDLHADAIQILELYRAIRLDAAGSLAERFMVECRQLCDVKDANRLGTRRRAERLLGELLA